MTSPRCPYYTSCGGCVLQHIDYNDQLESKKEKISSIISSDQIKVFHDEPYGYRTRMDLIFHPEGIGFRKRGNWKKIIDIDQCPISNEQLNQLMSEVREEFTSVDAFDLIRGAGTFKYCVIRTPPEDSSLSFVLNKDSSRIREAVERIQRFASKTSANNVAVTYVGGKEDVSVSEDYFVVKGKDMLQEQFFGKRYLYSVQGFFQNNHNVAEKMVKYVHDLFLGYDTAHAKLLDLYGGVGTFGIMNANMFKSVTIIESFRASVELAKKNLALNKVSNAETIALDARKIHRVPLERPLYVVTDPPRSGMHMDTITHLKYLEPEAIIYISCNADQLKKDLTKFSGYGVGSAALFDMFPQTNHSETVVELVRK